MPKKYHPFESSVKGIEIPHFLSLILTDIYFKIGSENFKSAKPKNTVINAIAGKLSYLENSFYSTTEYPN